MTYDDAFAEPYTHFVEQPEHIDQPTWRSLRDAWRRLEELPLSDVQGALDAYIATAVEGARASFGVALVFKRLSAAPAADPMGGWRVVDALARACDGDALAPHAAFFSNPSNYTDDPVALRSLRPFGRDRVCRMVDLRELDPRLEGPLVVHLRALGVADRLAVSTVLDAETELVLLLDRRANEGRFDRCDLDWLAGLLAGTGRAARAIVRGYGHLNANAPLTTRERHTLRLLLTDRAEKEIADAMKLSPMTVHTHVKSIYRKFGVMNRAGLLDLWLNPRVTPPALVRGAQVGRHARL